MENTVSVQTIEFLNSALLGIALGVLYDVLKTIRYYIKKGKGITNLFDSIFWIVAVVSLFAFVLVSAGGRMRWYILVGAFCGGFVYRAAASEIVFKVMRGTVCILAKLLQMCSRPAYLFLKSIRNLFIKTGKRLRNKKISHKKKRKRKADELGSKKK